MRLLFILSLLTVAFAMNKEQAEITRTAMVKYGAPQFSVIVDGVQHPTYAFTTGDRKVTYIDFKRFANAPNSLRRVLWHEIGHLRGRDHNNIPGDIMSYHLTVALNGTIIDDPPLAS